MIQIYHIYCEKAKSALRAHAQKRNMLMAYLACVRVHWPGQLALHLRMCARALRPCQLVFHILLRKCQIASTVFPLYISLIPVKKMPIVKKTVIFFILQVFSLLLCVFLFKKYNMKLKFNSGYWKIAGLRPSASGLLFSGELLETGSIHNLGYWKVPPILRGTLGNCGHS